MLVLLLSIPLFFRCEIHNKGKDSELKRSLVIVIFNILLGCICCQKLYGILYPELFIPHQILIWITLFHLQYWIFRGVVISFLSKRLLETKRSTECDCYCVLGHTNPFVRTIFFKLTGTHQDKDWICRRIWKNSSW